MVLWDDFIEEPGEYISNTLNELESKGYKVLESYLNSENIELVCYPTE